MNFLCEANLKKVYAKYGECLVTYEITRLLPVTMATTCRHQRWRMLRTLLVTSYIVMATVLKAENPAGDITL